jgi:hypothetical protein
MFQYFILHVPFEALPTQRHDINPRQRPGQACVGGIRPESPAPTVAVGEEFKGTGALHKILRLHKNSTAKIGLRKNSDAVARMAA